MKTALGAFYAAADDVARDLFVAFARAARLDASGDGPFAADASALADRFLEDFGPASQCSMRAMRYPGTDDPDARAIAGRLIDRDYCDVDHDPSRSYSSGRTNKRRRRGLTGSDGRGGGHRQHTDFECFTLLHQSAPGLELRDLAGAWRTARCDPDRSMFTIIVADMLERWTRGYFLATPHRVDVDGERLSLVRFNGLDPGAVVAPLARWFPGSSPANKKYAPVAQGEHTAALVTRAAKNLERARTAAARSASASAPSPKIREGSRSFSSWTDRESASSLGNTARASSRGCTRGSSLRWLDERHPATPPSTPSNAGD